MFDGPDQRRRRRRAAENESDEDTLVEDTSDDDASLESVRRALAGAWGGHESLWNDPPYNMSCTASTTSGAVAPASFTLATTAASASTVPTTVASGSLSATGQVPTISIAAWNQQQEEMARLTRLVQRLETQGRTVATQETKIPNFEGFSDARSAEVWWTKAESVAMQYGWTDERFIEAASNCFTKSAESWYLDLKFKAENRGDRTLRSKEDFKAAFFKQFDTQKSIASQMRSMAELKQTKEENVNAYWVRVSNTFNDIVAEYRDDRGWEPSQNPVNDDFFRMAVILDFVDTKLKVMSFVNGLNPAIGDIVRPRVKELQQAGKSVLDAAREAEISRGKDKASTATAPAGVAALEDIDWSDTPSGTRDAVVAAFHAAGRGGRGGRGGRRGRGGRGGRGGGRGREPNLRDIQSRERPRFCGR